MKTEKKKKTGSLNPGDPNPAPGKTGLHGIDKKLASEWGAFRPRRLTRLFMVLARNERLSAGIRRAAANVLRNAAILTRCFYDLEWSGLRLRLCPGANSDDNWLLRCGRHPEQADLDWLKNRYAGQNLVFADVGANVGIHSLVMARALDPASTLIALEPHPDTFKRLLVNLRLNNAGHVRAINTAVGETDGEGLLIELKRRNAGENSLVAPSGCGTGHVRVPVRQLDSIRREQGAGRIDLLKIDVEGAEDRVLLPYLKTAPETAWPRHVMLEVDKRDLWAEDCEAALIDRGYRLAFENPVNRHYVREPAG